MAVAVVTLESSLQAWSAAGLQYLLLERPCGAGASEDVVAGEEAPSEDVSLPVAAVSAVAATNHPPFEAKSQRYVSPLEPKVLSFADAGPIPDDSPASWGDAWTLCFSKAVPAPVVWTYHNLGADITGIGRSVARSELLRSLIGELQLPRGSSAFWPCAVPSGESSVCVPSPGIFAAGLARLAPRLLVVFGKDALCDMGLPEDSISYFRHVFIQGKVVALFPSPEVLVQENARRIATVSLLRALLADML